MPRYFEITNMPVWYENPLTPWTRGYVVDLIPNYLARGRCGFRVSEKLRPTHNQ